MRPRVVIIGGGISGLSAAHRLFQRQPRLDVHLFEASGRLGGVLRTHRQDGFLIEEAADNFLTAPRTALELCEDIGLADGLLRPMANARRAFVLHRGKLCPLPDGFQVMAPGRIWPLLTSPLLSSRGKARVALDLVSRAHAASEDESVAQFARRHFGREALDRLIQPLLGGIYTADVEELSVEAALPRFRHMERERGSLIRALWAQNRKKSNQPSSGPPPAPFAAPRDGMSSLLASLGDRLPWDGASLNAPVDQLVLRNDGQWQIAVGGREPRRILAQAVIVAAPAPESSRLLQKLDAPLARHLGEVAYAGCAIACLGYDRAQITHPLNGGGFVVPLVEQRLILCCSFSSQKYSRRAPEGAVLLRVFMGGACQSGLLALADADLLQLAEREIGELLGIRGEPVVRRLVRHRRAMPQYHVGHLRRVAAIEQRTARFPRLRLAGSAYRGVGVPACIQSGYDAADSLIEELQGSSTFRAIKEPAQLA